MKKFYSIVFVMLATTGILSAQHADDPVLFTFGNESVTVSEFEYVYNKSNPNHNSQNIQDLKDYLELYINFKLKVKEARDLQIDTLPKVQHELNIYQSQLLQSYIDKEILDALTQSTYDRLTKDVKVSHIMISVKPGAPPADTLRAYNKIMNLRNRIIKGEAFDKVAKEASDDQSAKENGGNIGYITALQIPFLSFEDAAYNTPVGTVSMPIRTRLGYHLLMPTDIIPARGKIMVAHILIETGPKATNEEINAARDKAQMIYDQLKQGADFDELAAQYSDDKQTAKSGGKLPVFGVGRMVAPFEQAAFALQKDGDISEPVQTQFGFHIIKRLQKIDIQPYETIKDELEKKVKKDNRYKEAQQHLLAQYKKEYGYMEFPSRLDACSVYIDSSIYKGKWHQPEHLENDQAILMIGDKSYYQSDFLNFIQINQSKIRSGNFNSIIQQHYQQFSLQKLEEFAFTDRYPEYAYLAKEYVDGTLLFKLTEDKVWSKAMQDSAGLSEYYEAHKTEYMWGKRVQAAIYHVSDIKSAKKIKRWSKKMTKEEIMMKLNTDPSNPVVNITENLYEKGQDSLIDQYFETIGWSDMLLSDSGTVSMVWVKKQFDAMPKSLDEAKGYFISDYQDYLEKAWIKSLRKKYPVKINTSVLQSLAH